ncbi:AraC family transcriptional regulator [Paenibacillus sp.]|uniref:AraC family transcriptional regulator n=1 Tax=Paenibacillus sp. TaxID=58172 RepID=UPI002D2AF1AC|nr:AraC family transcriptional regulator [Paenibacillus sp.]HZG55693.1 AraC family transcriptional regulator [Paenibacillus sp.]
MKWSQQQLNQCNALLNEYAVALRGKDVSYYVHYWGGETRLYTNHVHKHSFFEICYILDGAGEYEEGNERIALTPGVLFLSRPHRQHQIKSEGGLYIVFLAFELIEAESSLEAVERFQRLAKTDTYWLKMTPDQPIPQLWSALVSTTIEPCSFLEDHVLSLSRALVTSFEAAFNRWKPPQPERLARPNTTTFVHRAKLYIRDNLPQPLKLSDVAEYLHISPRHLSRLFTGELGQSFTDYVRKERVRQAAAMLTTTDWSIKRIAEATGFDTVHYFANVFKAETGLPPGEFSKKFRGQPELFRPPADARAAE